MLKSELKPLANLLSENKKVGTYHITQIASDGFFSGRKNIGRFEIEHVKDRAILDICICDWRGGNNWYIIESDLRFEISHKEGNNFVWLYRPSKRDEKNEARKSRFEKFQGSLKVKIPMPKSKANLPTFFDRLCTLRDNREAAEGLKKTSERIFGKRKEQDSNILYPADTTIEQTIEARLGQNKFRRALLSRSDKCELTGIALQDVLSPHFQYEFL